jgi:hypothetical protein
MMQSVVLAAGIITAVLWFLLLEDIKRVEVYEIPRFYSLSIPVKIVRAARISGVDGRTLLRIAQCESGMNPKAKNRNSSASGLFQIINSTFKQCEGDVFNEDDNIACAVKLAKVRPTFSDWNESKRCWT